MAMADRKPAEPPTYPPIADGLYFSISRLSSRINLGSQYDACASVTIGSAVETNGSMYSYVRIEFFSNLTYAYIVSIALQVMILMHVSY